MKDRTLIRLYAMTLIAVVLIIDAIYWKINHAIWSLGITALAGLGGYEVGLHQGRSEKKH